LRRYTLRPGNGGGDLKINAKLKPKPNFPHRKFYRFDFSTAPITHRRNFRPLQLSASKKIDTKIYQFIR
jgi:hypothetical protein